MQTVWLGIDLERGWVHWRQRVRRYDTVESFSVDRLDHLKIERKGWGIFSWRVLEIVMDHPRLGHTPLGWWLSRHRTEDETRRLAAALNLCWWDELQLLHVARPTGQFDYTKSASALGAGAAPPEIDVCHTETGTLILLPNFAGLTYGDGLLFLYGVLWNLWAWSCLVYEAIYFGPPAQWLPEQMLALGLLTGAALAGVVMLHSAMIRVLGRQGLRWDGEAWLITRTWMGTCWGWKRIELRPGTWLRRVDPPGEECGLWVTTNGPELRLGHELSSDGLAWLQRTLLWPEFDRD